MWLANIAPFWRVGVQRPASVPCSCALTATGGLGAGMLDVRRRLTFGEPGMRHTENMSNASDQKTPGYQFICEASQCIHNWVIKFYMNRIIFKATKWNLISCCSVHVWTMANYKLCGPKGSKCTKMMTKHLQMKYLKLLIQLWIDLSLLVETYFFM